MKAFQRIVFGLWLITLAGCAAEAPEPEPGVNGRVVFWTHVDDNIGNVEVTLNGIKQTSTKVTGDYGPACGTSGFATYQMPDGQHHFTARELTSPFRQWEGDASFTFNTCYPIRLTAN